MIVLLLFLNGHKNIVRMHGSMQSPVTDMPAGWATVHRTTTVQSATLTVTQAAITGSALTATTTTTAVAGAGAAADGRGDAVPAAAGSGTHATSSGGGGGISHLLGDLQHSVHAILAAGGWKPGAQLTRAQLAAAAAAAMPDGDRDIELHPHKVAAVVGRAKAAQQLAALAQQHGLPAAGVAAAAGAAAGGDAQTSAETYAVSAACVAAGPALTADSLGQCCKHATCTACTAALTGMLRRACTAGAAARLCSLRTPTSQAAPQAAPTPAAPQQRWCCWPGAAARPCRAAWMAWWRCTAGPAQTCARRFTCMLGSTATMHSCGRQQQRTRTTRSAP